MIILGIVGSPAGGKSTVASLLQDRGATWINADQIARRVLQQQAVQRQLIAHFGSKITGNDGRIERRKLAREVFGDDDSKRAALTYLESVIHPETRRVITGQLKEASDRRVVASILDVPLLFESQWDRCCDEIWCVESSNEVRLKRAEARGWDEAELQRRENNQLNIEEKRRLSNFVVTNNGSLGQLTDTVGQQWSSLLEQNAQDTSDRHCLPPTDTV